MNPGAGGWRKTGGANASLEVPSCGGRGVRVWAAGRRVRKKNVLHKRESGEKMAFPAGKLEEEGVSPGG